jgi:hypothetical protein
MFILRTGTATLKQRSADLLTAKTLDIARANRGAKHFAR